MAKKKDTVAKTTKEETKAVQKEAVKETPQEVKAVEVDKEPIKEKEAVVEPKKEESDGNVWVKDWRELVKVEGSKDDRFGRQYYGVKR